MTSKARDDESVDHYSLPAIFCAIKESAATSVQDYLKIQGYADMPISELGFSVRPYNCLTREFGEGGMAHEIMEMSLQSFIGMKSAGAKTFREILSRMEELAHTETEHSASQSDPTQHIIEKSVPLTALRPYASLIAAEQWDEIEAQMETDAEIDILIRAMDITELIGADMVAAALSDPYPTQVLLPALQDFIREQDEHEQRRREIQALVDQLPKERIELPVKPFLSAWTQRGLAQMLEQTIDDILTFRQLADRSAQFSDDEYSVAQRFLRWCTFDIEQLIKKTIAQCIRTDKTREIVALRAEGKTLAEIGEMYQVTRERIRQIEMKAVKNCKTAGAEAVLLKISAIRGGDEILTASEIGEYCGESAQLFLHLIRNIPDLTHFQYTKALDAFILGNKDVEEEHVRSFVDALPDQIGAWTLSDVLNKASEQGIPPELVELQIHEDYNYTESIQAWQRGKLNIRKMCREILPSFDPDGIRVAIPEELQEFRERICQRFGEEVRSKVGDDTLSRTIPQLSILRDRGTYVSVRDHILSDDLLQRISAYVNQGNSEVYMFSTLFEVFREELQQAGVDNRYYLQGILRYEWDDLYSFSRDCISKGERATNIYATVEDFIRSSGHIVSKNEIREAFPGISDAVLGIALSQKKIIAFDGKYIHADSLHIDDAHTRFLHRVIDDLVRDGAAHHSRELFAQVNTFAGYWLDEVDVTTHAALFSISAHLFDDEYVFSRPWIAKKGTIGEETLCNLRSRDAAMGLDDQEATSGDREEAKGSFVPSVSAELTSRWNSILEENFADGLRLNGMRLRKFRNIYEERYHDALEPNDELLIAMLKQACDFRDERVYARQDGAQVSLIETIRQEIMDTLTDGASCIYPQKVFERYKAQLADQLSVYNMDSFMRSLLGTEQLPFRFRWGTLCLPGRQPNIDGDLRHVFQKCSEPLTYTQLEEQLWFIPLDRIKHGIGTEPAFVNIDQETFFYAPNFPISTRELSALKHAMQLRIDDEGYIVARDLRELMQTYSPNAMMDTANWKDWGIRNAIAYLLRDAFDFAGVIISGKGAGLTTSQIFRSFCRNHPQLSLEQLKDLATQLEVTGIYWPDITAEMVRISQTEFVSKRDVRFDIEATDAVLVSFCPGDYIPLKDITFYMALPGANYPWNGFLLESYLRSYSRTFRLEQAGPTEYTYIGAMVRRTSRIRTLQDLLIDVLAHEESWTNMKEAFTLIAQKGYRSSRTMTNATEIVKAAQALRERLRTKEE